MSLFLEEILVLTALYTLTSFIVKLYIISDSVLQQFLWHNLNSLPLTQLMPLLLHVASGDHWPGGAAHTAESGECWVEPPKLLPVQTTWWGIRWAWGPAAAQPGGGPAEEGGGRPRDAPQQPETGKNDKRMHSHNTIKFNVKLRLSEQIHSFWICPMCYQLLINISTSPQMLSSVCAFISEHWNTEDHMQHAGGTGGGAGVPKRWIAWEGEAVGGLERGPGRWKKPGRKTHQGPAEAPGQWEAKQVMSKHC